APPAHSPDPTVKLLRTTLAVLAGGGCLLAVAVSLASPTWEVEVRRTVRAGPAAVHARLDPPERWRSWATTETEQIGASTGPSGGAGAGLEWESDRVGSGRIELTASDPAKGVWFDLFTGDGVEPVRCAILLASAAEGACEVTVVCRGEAGRGPIARLLWPSALGEIERSLARLLERLAAHVEEAG
ncbi:MAG: SRPBCC family protein, partial [Planctomycetota bacterium]|nr:SRPBCC family protein [Planctomycetota bacterium]